MHARSGASPKVCAAGVPGAGGARRAHGGSIARDPSRGSMFRVASMFSSPVASLFPSDEYVIPLRRVVSAGIPSEKQRTCNDGMSVNSWWSTLRRSMVLIPRCHAFEAALAELAVSTSHAAAASSGSSPGVSCTRRRYSACSGFFWELSPLVVNSRHSPSARRTALIHRFICSPILVRRQSLPLADACDK